MQQSPSCPVRIPLREMRANFLGTQRRLVGEHGGFVRYQVLRRVFTLMADADASHQVFVRKPAAYRRGLQYDNLALAIGRGLLCSDGELWQRQRRLTQPAFNKATMARVVEITAALAAETLDEWGGTSRPVDVFAAMQNLAMRTMSRTLFGQDLPVADDLEAVLSLGLEIVMVRNISPLAPPMWLPLRRHRAFRKHLGAVDRLIYERIAERLADRDGYDDLLGDLIRAYLAAGEAVQDGPQLRRELRDQAITLFYAGFETTAAALTWTWLLLSQNPEAEASFHAELESVLPGGRTPTLADLPRLSYTHQVIQESMRLYPPVYTITRQAVADDQAGRHRVRRGDDVVVPVHAMHRMAEYWDQPEDFRPERFTRLTDVQRKAYLPFNAGPHRCLGASFATTEMLTALAVIGHRVRLTRSPDDPVEVQVAVTQRPKNGLLMRVEPRVMAMSNG
jgi:cytochrome P450